MATFVLVHGAWHGGWCWTRTADALRALGHRVVAPTLTGLGERAHLLSADITPDTHVQDILGTLDWRDLDQVILVGHSYGGMVITGVAAQVPEKLRALIYLDALVPEHSDASLFSEAPPERSAGFRQQIAEGAIGLVPDDRASSWSDDPDTLAWILSKCTPHPRGCFEHGVTLTGREKDVSARHYILAARNAPSMFEGVYARLKDKPGWTTATLPYLHDVMVEAPKALADHLHRYEAGLSPKS